MAGPAETQPPRLRLRVTAAAESRLRAGHPWLFSESVREQNRAGQGGELAVVYDRKDRFLAVGLFDPDSPIRLRVLHAGKPQAIDHAWWARRLEQALERRHGLFDQQTTGFRCINGESDGWPGLVLDRYGGTLVLKLYTAAWLPRLKEVLEVLRDKGLLSPALSSRGGHPSSVAQVSKPAVSQASKPAGRAQRQPTWKSAIQQVWKPALPTVGRQPLTRDTGAEGGTSPPSREPVAQTQGQRVGEEGPERVVLRLSRNIQALAQQNFGRVDGQLLLGPPLSGPVVFLETGLRFEAEVLRGQKTGFFLDQRENRRKVGALAAGRRVLNAFSFSGGFSLYAARGGAAAVTDLDISAHALASAERNFALNQGAVPPLVHDSVQADAFEWLACDEGRRFELIVLDPPSLAKRESERAGAIAAYERLAALALEHLVPGGVLVACSCSAHVSAEEFWTAVRRAVTRSGRRFEELETTRHAPDHPASFPEGNYLKAIYLGLKG